MDNGVSEWSKNIKKGDKSARPIEKERSSVYYRIDPEFKNSVDFEIGADLDIEVSKYRKNENMKKSKVKL